jgi:transcriptional regulator with XRE-family HTH domain
MALKRMNLDQFLEFMKKQQGDKTAQQFAARLGVSPQYLSDVFNGRRPPGESITSALNVEKAVVYSVPSPSKAGPAGGEKRNGEKPRQEKPRDEKREEKK